MPEKPVGLFDTGTYKVRGEIPSKGESFKGKWSNEVSMYSIVTPIDRLIELFPTPEKYGIFSFMYDNIPTMQALFNSMGYTDDGEHNSLQNTDIDYIYRHSGFKRVSTLITMFIARYTDDEELSEYPMRTEDFQRIADIIYQRYYIKWKKLWETVSKDIEYLNPSKLDVEEEMTDTLNSNSHRESTYAESNEHSVYGYNSTEKRPSDFESDNSTNKAGETYSRTNPKTRTTHRVGAIGNVSQQQLLTEYREMLQWQFWDVAFKDVDEVLTCGAW